MCASPIVEKTILLGNHLAGRLVRNECSALRVYACGGTNFVSGRVRACVRSNESKRLDWKGGEAGKENNTSEPPPQGQSEDSA